MIQQIWMTREKLGVVLQELELVGHQNSHFVRQVVAQADLEDVLGYFGVHCAQGVVEEQNVGVRIHCSRQADSGLLTARNVDSSFSYPSIFFFVKDLHISAELAHVHDFPESLLVILETKKNIFLDSALYDKWLLLDKSAFSFYILLSS